MGLPPVVTGVSPKEGPPGTRVTIRGENLGNSPEDIIGLTICGSDCLLSAEWKSSNKIVARSGPGKGRGDIHVLTRSGGAGSCTVQFRGYHETTGPLKESAVWVDESHLSALGRHRTLIPLSYQQEDPLGLSVENNDKKFPEEELHDLFPDGSGDLGAENFAPTWFLLERHHTTSFDDLKAGLSFLRRRVEAQKDGQISFLKSHTGSVVEQMDTLTVLKDNIEANTLKYGPDLTVSLEKSILMAKAEADRLFEDVLERKDRADGTRNALGVLQRFRFLFHLPASLERNIERSDYDLVINDYARAKALFGATDVQVFQRVLHEADQRILALRHLLQKRLLKFPASLDEQKKIIRNLVHLETPDDPAWNCAVGQYQYCAQLLFHCKDEFISIHDTPPEKGRGPVTAAKARTLTVAAAAAAVSASAPVEGGAGNQTPTRIAFLEELNELFAATLPELWRLGQAYFTGELYVNVDHGKQDEFKKMVLDVVTIYSQLIRAALLPHTLDKSSPHRTQFGMWPAFNGAYSDQEGIGSWYVGALRVVRDCYSAVLGLDLPAEAVRVFQDLLHDLRVHCMRSLLMQAGDNVAALGGHHHQHGRDQWRIEFVEHHGSISQLPHLFETQVVECLQLVKETVFQAEAREPNLMENRTVLAELNVLVQVLLTNLPRALEHLAFADVHEPPAIAAADDVQQQPHQHVSRELKLLLCLSNCQYTMRVILPRLRDHWNKLGYPNLSVALAACRDQLEQTDQKLMEGYLEEKVEPLIGMIETSMYADHFAWDRVLERPHDVRPYCKEVIMNLIAVHAQVAQVCPSLVSVILERVARDAGAELGRLYSCVQGFSPTGALQARADAAALSRACRRLTTDADAGGDPFAAACQPIPPLLTHADELHLKTILDTFERRMKFQLYCLDI